MAIERAKIEGLDKDPKLSDPKYNFIGFLNYILI